MAKISFNHNSSNYIKSDDPRTLINYVDPHRRDRIVRALIGLPATGDAVGEAIFGVYFTSVELWTPNDIFQVNSVDHDTRELGFHDHWVSYDEVDVLGIEEHEREHFPWLVGESPYSSTRRELQERPLLLTHHSWCPWCGDRSWNAACRHNRSLHPPNKKFPMFHPDQHPEPQRPAPAPSRPQGPSRGPIRVRGPAGPAQERREPMRAFDKLTVAQPSAPVQSAVLITSTGECIHAPVHEGHRSGDVVIQAPPGASIASVQLYDAQGNRVTTMAAKVLYGRGYQPSTWFFEPDLATVDEAAVVADRAERARPQTPPGPRGPIRVAPPREIEP